MEKSRSCLTNSLAIAICLTFYCNYSIAQKSVIATDTVTAQINGSVPFDMPFILKYSSRGKQQIYSAELFEVDKKGEIINSAVNCGKKKSKGKGIKSRRLNLVNQAANGDVSFLVPALEPNKRFIIFITAFSSPEGIKNIVKVLAKNWDLKEVEILFKDMSEKYRLTFPNPYINCPADQDIFNIGSFDHFITYLEDSSVRSLMARQSNLQEKEDNIRKKDPGCKSPGLLLPSDGYLKMMLELSQECLKCKDSAWQYLWATDSKFDLGQLSLNLAELNSPQIYSGEKSLATVHGLPVTGDINYDSSVRNLEYTHRNVEYFAELIKYYNLKYPAFRLSDPGFEARLEAANDILADNYLLIKQRAKEIKEMDSLINIPKDIIDRVVAHYPEFALPMAQLSSDSYTFNFDTRAGFSLKADIGFLGYRIPADPHVQFGFAPYLGFHVNFRELNTDVPYRLIPHKGLLGHLSFNAGVSLTSIADAGKRNGLIGATSIFTGLGYGFSHSIRVNAGFFWYRKEDPNPLISHETTAAIPYAGLSIDLRLKDITSTFKQFFNL